MRIKELIKDLEKIRQDCSDKMVDLDEVVESLDEIIQELRNIK